MNKFTKIGALSAFSLAAMAGGAVAVGTSTTAATNANLTVNEATALLNRALGTGVVQLGTADAYVISESAGGGGGDGGVA